MSFNLERDGDKKRIIIVGGGFGGLNLAKSLRKSDYQVILIDKNNYHQFPPLIYQIASAGLEPSSISFPFRRIFRKYKNLHFRLATLLGVFPEEKKIITTIGEIDYDYLVLAAGSTTNFFGNEHIEDAVMPMKTVSDAMGLRNAVLANLERSITCSGNQERLELQNIVIVGGGATGVEIAGALSEMKRYVIPYDYPDIDESRINIFLIESSGRLLAGMSPKSSEKADKFLREMGVNICQHKRVVDYRDHKAILDDGMEIPTRTFIWTTGVKAVPIGNIPEECQVGRGKRIKVDAYNKIRGLDDIYCIGDQCLMDSDSDYPKGHPQLAQVAIQQGKLLGENLKRIAQNKPLQPFKYKNLGSMATIGRNKAVAEFSHFKTQGFIAWLLWLFVHLMSIVGGRNKINVLLNWMWNYFTYDQSLRIIVYARKSKEVREREEKERRRIEEDGFNVNV